MASTAFSQNVHFARDAAARETSLDDAGGVLILATLREVRGKLVVCGASWLTNPDASVRVQRRKMVANQMVVVNGTIVNANPTGLASHGTGYEAVKGGAKCVATGRTRDPAFAKAELRVRNSTFYSY